MRDSISWFSVIGTVRRECLKKMATEKMIDALVKRARRKYRKAMMKARAARRAGITSKSSKLKIPLHMLQIVRLAMYAIIRRMKIRAMLRIVAGIDLNRVPASRLIEPFRTKAQIN